MDLEPRKATKLENVITKVFRFSLKIIIVFNFGHLQVGGSRGGGLRGGGGVVISGVVGKTSKS